MKSKNKFKTISITALAFMALFSNYAQTTNPGNYCAASYTDIPSNVPHYIGTVSLGTLSNNSGPNQYPGNHYVFYSNLPIPTLMENETYTIAIKHDDKMTTDGLAAWIDFNGDFDFDEANEKLGETFHPGDGNSITGITVNYTFTVPHINNSYTTRMRVRIYEDDAYSQSGINVPVLPCTYGNGTPYNWGETEDYTVYLKKNTTNAISETPEEKVNFKQHGKIITFENDVLSSVYDVNGQLIKQVSHKKELDLQDLNTGMYIVHITADDAISSIRIYIE